MAGGLASRPTRVATMFLTASGELDTTIGFGGTLRIDGLEERHAVR